MQICSIYIRLGQLHLELSTFRKFDETTNKEESLSRAQEYFEKAISLPGTKRYIFSSSLSNIFRDLCDAHYGNAQCYKILRKWEDVAKECNKALKVDENFVPIMELLGEAELVLSIFYSNIL